MTSFNRDHLAGVTAQMKAQNALKQRFFTWGAKINFWGAGEGHICGGQR